MYATVSGHLIMIMWCDHSSSRRLATSDFAEFLPELLDYCIFVLSILCFHFSLLSLVKHDFSFSYYCFMNSGNTAGTTRNSTDMELWACDYRAQAVAFLSGGTSTYTFCIFQNEFVTCRRGCIKRGFCWGSCPLHTVDLVQLLVRRDTNLSMVVAFGTPLNLKWGLTPSHSWGDLVSG